MFKHIEDKSDKVNYLMIFLHGYSLNRFDLFGLKEFLRINDKKAHFISLEAPDVCKEFVNGSQWFSMKDIEWPPIKNINIEKILCEIDKNSKKLSEFIDLKIKEDNIGYSNVFLLGFSQGAIMSLYTSFRIKEQLGGIISCSGCIIDDYDFFNKNLFNKQKILFLYGENDNIIDINNFNYSETIINKYFKNESKIHKLKSLGHSINKEELDLINNFLKNNLNNSNYNIM